MVGKFGRHRPYYSEDASTLAVLTSGAIDVGDFTDGTGTSGYYDLTSTLPIGAIPLGWKANVTTAFASSAAFSGDPTTLAFVDGGGSDDTITDSASGFVTDGFTTGDLITVTGATTAGNNTTYTLTNVSAGTLTMATASVDTAEAGIAGTTIVATVASVLLVGIVGDTNKYSANSSASLAAVGHVGSNVIAADACGSMGTAQTVRLTVTETADFTDYDVGTIVVDLFYINTFVSDE